jgi:hypothetical protein
MEIIWVAFNGKKTIITAMKTLFSLRFNQVVSVVALILVMFPVLSTWAQQTIPHRIWSMYEGTTDGEYVDDVNGSDLVVHDGYLYTSGYAIGNGIATPGAFRSANPSNYDGFVAKYDKDSNIVWRTYIGGTHNSQQMYDLIYTLDVDKATGDIYIGGETASHADLAPASAFGKRTVYWIDSNQPPFAYKNNGLIMRLDKNGYPINFTYHGSTPNNRVVKNRFGAGRLAVIGFTQAKIDIANQGAYIDQNLDYSYRSYVGVFNPYLQQIWGTYLPLGLEAKSVYIDSNSRVYVVGYTRNLNSPDFLNSFNGGAQDGFVMVFEGNTGAFITARYFGGSKNDQIFDIDYSHFDNTLVLVGRTESSGLNINLPPSAIMGSFDAWILKVNPNSLAINWSKTFGSTGSDNYISVDILDSTGEIYAYGDTTSPNGMATGHPNILQSSAPAAPFITSSAILTKFTPNGQIEWSTYYGSAQETVIGLVIHQAYSVAVDQMTRRLYVKGHTLQTDLGFNSSNNSMIGFGDNYITRFAECVTPPLYLDNAPELTVPQELYGYSRGMVIAPFTPVQLVQPMIVTWSAIGLPQGLTIDSSTGEISGTPTAPTGQYTVQVMVMNACQQRARAAFTIVIREMTDPCEQACVHPPSHMILWHTYDELGGRRRADTSGNNNTGILSDTDFIQSIPGYVSQAVRFIGNPSVIPQINVPASTSTDIGNGDMAADAWIRIQFPSGTNNIVQIAASHSGLAAPGFVWGIWQMNFWGMDYRIMKFSMIDQNNLEASYDLNVTNLIPMGVWTFVSVSFDRNAQTVTFNINNVQHGPFPIYMPTGFGSYTAPNNNIVTGAMLLPLGSTFDIDELEIFKRTISYAEFMSIYQAGNCGKCKH